MEKITLKVKSSSEFTNFLRRFSSIESTLLLEIENGMLKAKTHTPERSVVKSSKIDMGQIFDMEGVLTVGQNILFGIFSVDKLIESFKHFSESDLEFALSYENTADGMIGTEITLSSPSLTINFQCASLRLFTHITDEMMDRIADTASSEVNFVLTKELHSRVNSLSGIDSDQKLLTLTVKNFTVLQRT